MVLNYCHEQNLVKCPSELVGQFEFCNFLVHPDFVCQRNFIVGIPCDPRVHQGLLNFIPTRRLLAAQLLDKILSERRETMAVKVESGVGLHFLSISLLVFTLQQYRMFAPC